MSNKKINFGGKGYYIALVLCAMAIGIAGYVYYNGSQQSEELQQPTQDVQVMGTVPGQTELPTRPAPTEQTTQPTQPTVGKLRTCSPVDGVEVAPYAMEVLSYNQTTRDWRVHNGVDIAAEAGTAVCAAADGEVYTVYEDDQLGTTVVIRHEDGYVTTYSSLSAETTVTVGQTVTLGQTIGYVGTTALLETSLGDHVHFSVTCNGKVMDPEEFFDLA